VTIGKIQGGVRNNIIPDSVVLLGTVRTFDATMQDDIHARIRRTASLIAQSAGASADVTIQKSYPVTVNDAALVARMLPTLARVVGSARWGRRAFGPAPRTSRSSRSRRRGFTSTSA
jgi:amidohydrolase